MMMSCDVKGYAIGEGVSGDESETGDGEESVTGAVAHDASSTATIGSNLLYLSDEQDSSDNEELDSADDASLPGDYRHDDDVILDQAPPQRVHASVVGSHWALPSLPPPPTTPTSSGSRFSRSSRRCVSPTIILLPHPLLLPASSAGLLAV